MRFMSGFAEKCRIQFGKLCDQKIDKRHASRAKSFAFLVLSLAQKGKTLTEDIVCAVHINTAFRSRFPYRA